MALLEDGGYEGFTIAALCERAQVPPRAIYDRADTKDALFLAVYEHGIARVVADHAIFGDQFAAVVLRARDRITQTDPEAAARASFTTVFSTMVVRVAYRPAFTNPSMDDDTFVDALAGMVQRYLFGR